MLSNAKLQNLKAIHNFHYIIKSYQPVVINHKTTKFESNSQRLHIGYPTAYCCYQSQNYKIWKQFTTSQLVLYNFLILLSIAKLQNLKAIHNFVLMTSLLLWVVINHKTTKFESNSQRTFITTQIINGCYQSQNYKIWKQFTTYT